MANELQALTLGEYLTNTLLLPVQLRDAIVDQGYVSFTDFNRMTDHNIDDLSTNLRRPGGQVEDDQGNEMNDPGVATGHLHMTRFKQPVYFCNYCRITDRTIDPDVATLDRIAACYNHM